ncbi:hypothetical protein OFK41_13675 [Acinetobacter baumannii]|uniref:hypothetical protein n=1 Tax=Acinetobacter baumannii TaxID=470 RepID=UPI00225317AC|nr:hypothetical protein [Acinetobacter baumannii]MCX3035253.1 hypothetical protein [Acinetobacter baumannii]
MISKDYAVYKALKLLENKKPERPSEFARIMWPNSPRWTRRVKCGRNGVSVGGGMNLAGGAFLGKLRKANLISYGGVSKSMLKQSRLNFDKIEKCE